MAADRTPLQSVHSNDQDLVLLLSYSSGANRFSGSGPSNYLKVGFFKTDRTTQTDASDILELKKMSNEVESLVKEVTILKRGLESKTLLLKADYEKKVQQQSLDLYNRINDYNSYLQDTYLQRIEVLRNSFKQQLANEVAKINAGFEKYCIEVSARNQLSLGDNSVVMNILKQKDALISSLRERLLDYEMQEQMHQLNLDFKDEFERDQLVQEKEELKDQIYLVKKNAEKMSETINLNEMQIKNLEKEVQMLKEEGEKYASKLRKLIASEDNLKKQLDAEKSKRDHMLEAQKLKMENVLNATLIQMEMKEQTAQELAASLKEKETELADQRKLSSVQKEIIVKEDVCPVPKEVETEAVSKDKVIDEFQKLKKIDEEQRKLIESLKNQLERTNRIWEKKFAILKQSYHAIKDEMYLRCSLQRQAPILHCAFARYTPQIGSHSAPSTAQTEPHMNRTPSAPGAVNLRCPVSSSHIEFHSLSILFLVLLTTSVPLGSWNPNSAG
ncbi:uncharacterized protein C10orf67 homolog, mitochondrial isoform X3 [Stegostoma tigrinum]|uniref:uncharacterized protein C10orf67 homolog, mitochondrial isoform X3 n=1 Tax=Stegostoma tigrinum TaxID=3053191 RepID=UPI00202B6CB3|nr:uncharacterized protein C10orf67 homolog, mitochondrial isoform X3 [Stegostoma tigrinum]